MFLIKYIKFCQIMQYFSIKSKYILVFIGFCGERGLCVSKAFLTVFLNRSTANSTFQQKITPSTKEWFFYYIFISIGNTTGFFLVLLKIYLEIEALSIFFSSVHSVIPSSSASISALVATSFAPLINSSFSLT